MGKKYRERWQCETKHARVHTVECNCPYYPCMCTHKYRCLDCGKHLKGLPNLYTIVEEEHD